MEGPANAPLADEGDSLLGQFTTTSGNIRESWLKLWDGIVEVCVQLIAVVLSFCGDIKRVRRALCREIWRPRKPNYAPEDSKIRNDVQELYFGIVLLMVAVCSGEFVGSQLASGIFSQVVQDNPISNFFLFLLMPFYSYLCSFFAILFPAEVTVKIALLCLLPIAIYKHIRKPGNEVVIDGYRRRPWVFVAVFVISTMLGNLMGRRLMGTVPAVYFVPPLLLAIMIDAGFPLNLYTDRTRLRCLVWLFSMVSIYILLRITGMNVHAWKFIGILHCILLGVHMEVVARHIDDSNFTIAEAQFVYTIALLLLQVPVALLLGGESSSSQVAVLPPIQV